MPRAVSLQGVGDPPQFEIIEVGTVSEGEIVLELVAAEVTPFDGQIATGGVPATTPLQPGGSAVARVVRFSGFPAGSLVYVAGGPAGLGTRRPGTFAEVFTAPETTLIPLPGEIDPLAAAGGVSGALTARLALIDQAGFRAGERVLVLGATGAVGEAAAQIAHANGGRVLAGVRDPTPTEAPALRSPPTTSPAGWRPSPMGRGWR